VRGDRIAREPWGERESGGMLAAFVLFGPAACATLPFQAGINAELAVYRGRLI
jgi:hypothetical protein